MPECMHKQEKGNLYYQNEINLADELWLRALLVYGSSSGAKLKISFFNSLSELQIINDWLQEILVV